MTSIPPRDTVGGPEEWTAELRTLILAGRFDEADRLVARHRGSGWPPLNLEMALRQRWGFTLLERGELSAAEAQLRAAAALAPQDAEARADLAFVELRLGRHADAVVTLRQVLELAPGHSGALTNLAAAFMALNQPGEAETLYRRLLALEPANAAALQNLGVLLNTAERHDEALACADASLAARPGGPAFMARAAALFGLGRYEDCLDACAQAIAAGADAYEALTRRGRALAALGRFAESLAALDEAVTRRPEDYLAHYWRGLVRLQTGDFPGGWRDYEFRWRPEPYLLNFAGPAALQLRNRLVLDAQPQDLARHRVLVVGEQGIGDEIMFGSMLPDLARTASQVICACDRRLVRLFAASMPDVTFVPLEAAAGVADASEIILASGSLGRLYRNSLEQFPGTPYLRPRQAIVEGWARRLKPREPGAFRVGLSWRGGAPRTRRSERSMPLTDLMAPLQMPGVAFVSLQYGDVSAEVAAAQTALGIDIAAFDPAEIDDFEDLAGLIANLDVVVTVQTALVHLTGAMGATCLTLVPRVAEWRYMASGPAMPWYGSVRLFRQAERGAWGPVVTQGAEALAALASEQLKR